VLAACSSKTVDRGGERGQPGQDPALPPLPPLGELRGDGGAEGLTRRPIPPDGTNYVALLLPLSGANARLGASMLNAAELALFEIANEKFTLLPFDTKGTPEGAQAAAVRAITAGAQIILGPLLANSVRAVGQLARPADVRVVAFSNSREVAGEGVFIMGFDPQQQVDAIVDFAIRSGKTRFGVLAPKGRYGEAVIAAIQEAALSRSGEVTRSGIYDPSVSDHSAAVKAVSDYDLRREALMEQRAMLEEQKDEVSIEALKWLEKRDTIGDVSFDAILIPDTGQRLRSLASLLLYYDVDAPAVRILGLRNWDELPNPGAEPALVGAWYAASPPAGRQQFVTRYKKSFGRFPSRLASLAYDATALAAILAQGEDGPNYSFESLTNPNGFLGVDGLFRLNPSGTTERAFAILEVRRKGHRVLYQPPDTFERLTN
jgi:branched-chain amino acid transport system substrate-binding protein